jgi:hypothetical protein
MGYEGMAVVCGRIGLLKSKRDFIQVFLGLRGRREDSYTGLFFGPYRHGM